MRAISENLKNRFEKAQISRTMFAKLMGSSRTVVNRLGLLGLRLSRLTQWNEEESFSQKIAKITKTITRWKADAWSHLFISQAVEVHQMPPLRSIPE